jgi:hypothetical protein
VDACNFTDPTRNNMKPGPSAKDEFFIEIPLWEKVLLSNGGQFARVFPVLCTGLWM